MTMVYPRSVLFRTVEKGVGAIFFYAFDVLVLAGTDLRAKPLLARREMLAKLIASLPDAIRFTKTFEVLAAELMKVIRSKGLEGIVAKQRGKFV
jgi:bifunctional non-homologous end joining protein LigD